MCLTNSTFWYAEKDADFVRVYQCSDAACTYVEMKAELSGTYTSPQAVTTTSGYMLVWFTSDDSGWKPGFSASWTSSLPAPPVRLPVASQYMFARDPVASHHMCARHPVASRSKVFLLHFTEAIPR